MASSGPSVSAGDADEVDRAGARPLALRSAGHIPSLDGLRAVSIVIVFLSHAGVSGLIPGGFGVTVFFFLSGFLITTLLTREQDRHAAVSLRAFYLRRVLRLSPPILITLAAATGLVLVGLAQGEMSIPVYLSQIFFYYNYYSLYNADNSVLGLDILWSLSVEEHFYLIWPVLFIGVAKAWIGLRGVALLLGLILAWRIFRVVGLGDSEWEIYVSTDTRLDSILYGCLLALLIWRGHAARIFPDDAAPRLLWIAGALAVLLASFLIRGEIFRSTLRYSLQGLALAPLFYYAVSRSTDLPFRPLNWGPVRQLGVWSFTIYLCHLVIIEALVRNGVGQPGELRLILLAAGLSCAFAALVDRFAERPLRPLRARLTGH